MLDIEQQIGRPLTPGEFSVVVAAILRAGGELVRYLDEPDAPSHALH
jgi:hypothetical protein